MADGAQGAARSTALRDSDGIAGQPSRPAASVAAELLLAVVPVLTCVPADRDRLRPQCIPKPQVPCDPRARLSLARIDYADYVRAVRTDYAKARSPAISTPDATCMLHCAALVCGNSQKYRT